MEKYTIADFVRQSPYNKKLIEAEIEEFANRKNNKLIAEFMGMKLGEDHTNDNMYYDDAENLHPPTPINELKFNSSWDWLMPVVEKIESLGYWVNRNDGDITISNKSDMVVITPISSGGIDMMYKAVVMWIKDNKLKTI
tara:strand:+ start:211 stop:627 length:417 start_codon:yes stop_codon:yes gene_type:complete